MLSFQVLAYPGIGCLDQSYACETGSVVNLHTIDMQPRSPPSPMAMSSAGCTSFCVGITRRVDVGSLQLGTNSTLLSETLKPTLGLPIGHSSLNAASYGIPRKS